LRENKSLSIAPASGQAWETVTGKARVSHWVWVIRLTTDTNDWNTDSVFRTLTITRVDGIAFIAHYSIIWKDFF